MATAPSAAVRRGHFDGGGGRNSQGLDRLGSGASERKNIESNLKKKHEILVEEDDEEERPFCISRLNRKGDFANTAASSTASLRGGTSGSGSSSGAGVRVEGDASLRQEAVGSGVEKKRGLGEGGRGVGSGVGRGAPVTKKVRVGVGGIMGAGMRETDLEDEDEIPLAVRMNILKKGITQPKISTGEPLSTSLAAANKIMEAKKKARAEGLMGIAKVSSNGAPCPPKTNIPHPSAKEGQGGILSHVSAGIGGKPLERKVVAKALARPAVDNSVADSDDSDDDKPLSHRKSMNALSGREAKSDNKDVKDSGIKKRPSGPNVLNSNPPVAKKLKILPTVQQSKKPSSLQSPRSRLLPSPKVEVKTETDSTSKSVNREMDPDDEDDEMPLAQRKSSLGTAGKPTTTMNLPEKQERDPDDDDNVPLAKRKAVSIGKKPSASSAKSITKKVLEQRRKAKTTVKVTKKVVSIKVGENSNKIGQSGGTQKWETLEHNGVIFPPPYQPHGVKMLYDGRPVELTPEQEEVATMFAVMKDTEYATKPKFIDNFWADWKPILGSNHIIRDFNLCDFTPIYDWFQAEKEKKKTMTPQEKKQLKEEKMRVEEKYMWALVNGVKEKVGNFRVEPPGLFRGRGEHPKMGKLKKRIFPENIVINIGKGVPIPECPMPGHKWKEIRHDNTVTWLAFWNDPINNKEFKYVFLAASSSLKGQSDMEKYEKARILKDHIENIRKTYTKNFSSSDPATRQIAVATYLIDRLALRAGNEKDEDEADTVGCCSLKVEHVIPVPPNSLTFDFLGKDSIRYFNTVEVEEKVYKAIVDFKRGKQSGKDLFDKLDTSKLNNHLKGIMPALTAKVFRTYNASITLDTLLQDTVGNTVIDKVADYQRANKEVAILCNHQRTVSKSHSSQMEKLESKMAEAEELMEELKEELVRAKTGRPSLNGARKSSSAETLQKRILQTEQRIEKMRLDMKIKDDLKTVALGTSKINYMDPRITVAWCKRHEVPIEKVFNKSLLAKFAWAMDVDPEYRF